RNELVNPSGPASDFFAAIFHGYAAEVENVKRAVRAELHVDRAFQRQSRVGTGPGHLTGGLAGCISYERDHLPLGSANIDRRDAVPGRADQRASARCEWRAIARERDDRLAAVIFERPGLRDEVELGRAGLRCENAAQQLITVNIGAAFAQFAG